MSSHDPLEVPPGGGSRGIRDAWSRKVRQCAWERMGGTERAGDFAVSGLPPSSAPLYRLQVLILPHAGAPLHAVHYFKLLWVWTWSAGHLPHELVRHFMGMRCGLWHPMFTQCARVVLQQPCYDIG